MFAALEVLNNNTSTEVIDTDELVTLMMDHVSALSTELYEAKSLNDTIEALESLKSTIATYGFTESLLAFADADGTLSRNIPAMPSLESYMAHIDMTTDAAIEGLATTIKDAVVKFTRAFRAHIIKYKKWYTAVAIVMATRAIIGLGLLLYVGVMTSMLPSALLLPILNLSIQVTAYTYVATILIGAKIAPFLVKEVLEIKLPTTEEELVAYKAKVASLYKSRAGWDVYNLNAALKDIKPKEATLEELGYTQDNIKELILATKEAAENIKQHGNIGNQLDLLSKSPAVDTPSGRTALLWITEVVTHTMNIAVKAVQQSSTDAKKIVTAADAEYKKLTKDKN